MTKDDLKKRDFILLVDKSTSMNEKDGTSKTRWERAQEQTIGLAQECIKFDSNGITVGFFAGDVKLYDNVDGGDEVMKKIFGENEPNGSTDTAKALDKVLQAYLATRGTANCKPITVLVVTDGAATDEPALVKCIVNAANAIDSDEEIGISFLQIGTDQHAHDFLKRLDDNLVKEGAKFDIVDTKTFAEMENMTLVDVLMEAVTD